MTSITALTDTLSQKLLAHHVMLATAESCTGGGVSHVLTSRAGSSKWFERGFVTYSNDAKREMLGVRRQTLKAEGAVSEAVVQEMAEGAILHSHAHISVAISGIAGPDGGTKSKPVGTVWIAWSGLHMPTQARLFQFEGTRDVIRDDAIKAALKGLIQRLETYHAPPSTPSYFLALWPDEKVAQQLFEKASLLTDAFPCRPSTLENLHLTLAYLGQLEPELAYKLLPEACPTAPFELEISDIKHWHKKQIAYFSLEDSSSLNALHEYICQLLLAQGIKPERRAFLPHITIARNYSLPISPTVFDPILWQVSEIVLVESRPDGNKSGYNTIKRAPLQ